MKKLILYDLDGTLVDTREDIILAANFMRTELGHAPLTNQEVEAAVGHGLHYLIEKCLETKDEKQVEKGGKIYRQHYTEHMMDHSVLYPGIIEMLTYFLARKQAVVTNKPSPFSEQMLEALKIEKHFFSIVTGNSKYAKKPNPEAIHALMDQTGSSIEETLFVGDSTVDIETGKNAGVQTAVLSQGFQTAEELASAKPDFLFSNVNELFLMIKEKGW